MQLRTYEKPEFVFEEMKLTEDVAATCWGYAYAWYDANGDKVHQEEEVVKLKDLGLKDNGCQGSAAVGALVTYFNTKYPDKQITADDVSTNSNSKVVIPIGS